MMEPAEMQVTSKSLTSALEIVPSPLRTIQVLKEGRVPTVTEKVSGSNNPVMKVKLAPPVTVKSSPPLFCATKALTQPRTEPETVY